jgi:hypothetical protein
VSRCEQLLGNLACLENSRAQDPTEHHQLSGDPQYAAQIAKMRARLSALEATYFNPTRNSRAGAGVAARVAREKWGGYCTCAVCQAAVNDD